MESRLYFSLGDLAATVGSGVIVALVAFAIVDTSWNMLLAMLVMMVLAMLIALPLALPFMMLFGAMEVMIPVMLTTMISGMASGMWLAMDSLSMTSAMLIGAASGLASIVSIWIINSQLRGPRTLED